MTKTSNPARTATDSFPVVDLHFTAGESTTPNQPAKPNKPKRKPYTMLPTYALAVVSILALASTTFAIIALAFKLQESSVSESLRKEKLARSEQVDALHKELDRANAEADKWAEDRRREHERAEKLQAIINELRAELESKDGGNPDRKARKVIPIPGTQPGKNPFEEGTESLKKARVAKIEEEIRDSRARIYSLSSYADYVELNGGIEGVEWSGRKMEKLRQETREETAKLRDQIDTLLDELFDLDRSAHARLSRAGNGPAYASQ